METSQYLQPPSAGLLDALTSRIACQITALVGNGGRPHPMDHVSFRTFKSFIASIIFRSKVKSSVVLVASLYLDRCKSRFDAESFGQLWLKEKVFIVAMALANKYIEDRQVNAARWAKLSTIMHAEEIGAAERAFLQMIDWDLSVSVDHFSVDPTSPRSYTHS